MPRMRILNAEEKQEFDSPPEFNSVQRKQYFDITMRIEETLDKLQSPTNKVCYLVAIGYFKATKRFFGCQFHDRDIDYAARKLGYLPEIVSTHDYDEASFRRHQRFIREHLGFAKWDGEAKALVATEIRGMVRSQARMEKKQGQVQLNDSDQ